MRAHRLAIVVAIAIAIAIAFAFAFAAGAAGAAEQRWYVFSIGDTPVGYVSEEVAGAETRTVVSARLSRLGKTWVWSASGPDAASALHELVGKVERTSPSAERPATAAAGHRGSRGYR